MNGTTPRKFLPVYLTFDDGPDPQWTPQVLDALAEARMQATFFAIGEYARAAPDLLRRTAAEGHAIGNHTYSHRHPWFMTPAAARAQVRDGARSLGDILGRAPRLYRPPHGRERECMNDEAQLQGEHPVLWTLSAIDWGMLGTAQRIASRLAYVCANEIVLMHDGRNRHNRPDQLLEVLPEFLSELAQRQLRCAVCRISKTALPGSTRPMRLT
jgi:peptidoglycan/xylan/chitin deacetylase (PgdA/CDA1 family)